MTMIARIIFGTLFFAIALLTASIPGSAQSNLPLRSGNPLTEAERQAVREQLPRALFWYASWSRPRTCERKGTINLQDILVDFEGKEVRVQIEVSDASISATVDEFKHRVTFRRGSGAPFPFSSETFCEDTYASYLKNKERRMRDDQARAGNVPTTLAQKDANSLDVMLKTGISKTMLSDVVTSREEMNLTVPEKWAFMPMIDEPRTSATKTALYDAVLKTAASDPEFNCEKGRTAELWVPVFDERDPGVYVRVQERPGRGTIDGVSIVFFGFGRKAGSSAPAIVKVTRFDHIDDVYFFSGRITDLTYKVEKVVCLNP
jgi:hypothetical protein